MRYETLQELLQISSSTRRYFLSLPVEMQLALHEHNFYIHSAQELRQHVTAIQDYRRHVLLSGSQS